MHTTPTRMTHTRTKTYQQDDRGVVGPKYESRENRRLVGAACAEIEVQSFDVNGDKVANMDIAHDVLHYMARVRQVDLREYGLQHVEGAADCRNRHLFAGRSCDDQLTRGK